MAGSAAVVPHPHTLSKATGSDYVGHLNPLSGAVKRLISAYLDAHTSCRDAGATGDGSTDDRANLQTVIDGAGWIDFEEGDYVIGSSGNTIPYRAVTGVTGLELESNTVIQGQGFGTILRVADSSDAIPITANGKSNIIIKDLVIQGNSANQTDANGTAFGIYLYNCTNVFFDNVWVYDTHSNTIELIECDNVGSGFSYHETASPNSIGGGPQFEDCTNVNVQSVLGDTYDDLVSIIAHGGNVEDVTVSSIVGSSYNARCLFIGQSNDAAAQRTMRNITAHFNSNNCGRGGTTAAFTITRGALFYDLNVTGTDRQSYRTFQMAVYDDDFNGVLYNSTIDIESYDSDLRCVNVIHNDAAGTQYHGNTLRVKARNPNATDDATESDGGRIDGGEDWDIYLNLRYPAGKTNAAQAFVIGGSTGTNDVMKNSKVSGIIRGGEKNLQLNHCENVSLDGLSTYESTDANNTNIDITSNASGTILGVINRDGEINDDSTSTKRVVTQLYSSGTRVSTSGTGEDDLQTFTLPADWMGKNGRLHIRASGDYNGSNGNKTLKFHYGSASITMHGPSNLNGAWNADIYVTQYSGRNTQRLEAVLTYGNAVVYNSKSGIGVDGTSAVTIKFTGECSDASDGINHDTMLIEGS